MVASAPDPAPMGDAPVVVSIPARPDFVHVLRSVVASVAARADFTLDAIDDLRLIVDEACAQLLSYSRPAAVLTVQIRLSGEASVEVVVRSDADPAAWPPADAEGSLGWQVLSALADEARFEHAGGPALRLTKRRDPVGAA